MGFNISGFAINKNLSDKEALLTDILGVALEFEAAIDFETASENAKDDGIIDVYFGKNGTLIFAPIDMCVNDSYAYPDVDILTFAISETASAYHFRYTQNGELVRARMEYEDQIINEEGRKLPLEIEEVEIIEVIWKQMAKLLGESFWDIEPDAKVYRYKIVNQDDISNTEYSESVEIDHKIDDANDEREESSFPIQETYYTPPAPKKNNEWIHLAIIALVILIMIGALIYVFYLMFFD